MIKRNKTVYKEDIWGDDFDDDFPCEICGKESEDVMEPCDMLEFDCYMDYEDGSMQSKVSKCVTKLVANDTKYNSTMMCPDCFEKLFWNRAKAMCAPRKKAVKESKLTESTEKKYYEFYIEWNTGDCYWDNFPITDEYVGTIEEVAEYIKSEESEYSYGTVPDDFAEQLLDVYNSDEDADVYDTDGETWKCRIIKEVSYEEAKKYQEDLAEAKRQEEEREAEAKRDWEENYWHTEEEAIEAAKELMPIDNFFKADPTGAHPDRLLHCDGCGIYTNMRHKDGFGNYWELIISPKSGDRYGTSSREIKTSKPDAEIYQTWTDQLKRGPKERHVILGDAKKCYRSLNVEKKYFNRFMSSINGTLEEHMDKLKRQNESFKKIYESRLDDDDYNIYGATHSNWESEEEMTGMKESKLTEGYQESEYNDLGIDVRTGKPFGEPYDVDAPEDDYETEEDFDNEDHSMDLDDYDSAYYAGNYEDNPYEGYDDYYESIQNLKKHGFKVVSERNLEFNAQKKGTLVNKKYGIYAQPVVDHETNKGTSVKGPGHSYDKSSVAGTSYGNRIDTAHPELSKTEIDSANAVLSKLDKKGKLPDVAKKVNLNRGPDVTFKNDSAEITPDDDNKDPYVIKIEDIEASRARRKATLAN